MARKLIAPLAPGIELKPDYTVRLVALDPSTGTPVANVAVSGVAMQVVAADDDGTEDKPEPFVPLFTYARNGSG